MMQTINIIGAGRVGITLGKLMMDNKLGTVQAFCHRSIASKMIARQWFPAATACHSIALLPPADITLITTPDDQIKPAASMLAKSKQIKPKSLVFHCSGSLSSDELASLTVNDCQIASVHPMHSFAAVETSIETFQGTYCAVEGSLEAVAVMSDLFRRIGGIPFVIASACKVRYHIAGVMASNYVVTLCAQAQACLVAAGIDSSLAMDIVTNIMRGTINNLSNTKSVSAALTGPLKRADQKTLTKHLACLRGVESKMEALYRLMGELTLDIAGLSTQERQCIAALLSNDE